MTRNLKSMQALKHSLLIGVLVFGLGFQTRESRQSTTQILTSAAQKILNAAGADLTKEAQSSLSDFIENGVNTLSAENGGGDIKLATNNIEKFARELVKKAKRTAKGSQFVARLIVDQEVFEAARFSLCPLYPFC